MPVMPPPSPDDYSGNIPIALQERRLTPNPPPAPAAPIAGSAYTTPQREPRIGAQYPETQRQRVERRAAPKVHFEPAPPQTQYREMPPERDSLQAIMPVSHEPPQPEYRAMQTQQDHGPQPPDLPISPAPSRPQYQAMQPERVDGPSDLPGSSGQSLSQERGVQPQPLATYPPMPFISESRSQSPSPPSTILRPPTPPAQSVKVSRVEITPPSKRVPPPLPSPTVVYDGYDPQYGTTTVVEAGAGKAKIVEVEKGVNRRGTKRKTISQWFIEGVKEGVEGWWDPTLDLLGLRDTKRRRKEREVEKGNDFI